MIYRSIFRSIIMTHRNYQALAVDGFIISADNQRVIRVKIRKQESWIIKLARKWVYLVSIFNKFYASARNRLFKLDLK